MTEWFMSLPLRPLVLLLPPLDTFALVRYDTRKQKANRRWAVISFGPWYEDLEWFLGGILANVCTSSYKGKSTRCALQLTYWGPLCLLHLDWRDPRCFCRPRSSYGPFLSPSHSEPTQTERKHDALETRRRCVIRKHRGSSLWRSQGRSTTTSLMRLHRVTPTPCERPLSHPDDPIYCRHRKHCHHL